MMLQEADRGGWEAVGVETSDFAARYAEEMTGCKVHRGTLLDANFESGSFDVITLMDVIEHVPEPCALLDEVYRVLRPGGVTFLVTPNFGSFFVWLYGRYAYGIGPQEHVTYFRPSTMRTALRATGFRDITVGTKDFYADNRKRLLHGDSGDIPAAIKQSFGDRFSLRFLRRLGNRALMRVPIGDKLVGLAKK
jgi:SAM-dependent methyltransferase